MLCCIRSLIAFVLSRPAETFYPDNRRVVGPRSIVDNVADGRREIVKGGKQEVIYALCPSHTHRTRMHFGCDIYPITPYVIIIIPALHFFPSF